MPEMTSMLLPSVVACAGQLVNLETSQYRLLVDPRKASVMRKLISSPAIANRYVAALTSHMLASTAEATKLSDAYTKFACN